MPVPENKPRTTCATGTFSPAAMAPPAPSTLPYTNRVFAPTGPPSIPTPTLPSMPSTLPSTLSSSMPFLPAMPPIPSVSSVPPVPSMSLSPLVSTPTTSSAAPPLGSMGPPPAKAPEKPAKTNDYDFTDTLAGTGIDLSQEERIAAELSGANLFEHAARTGFPQLEPGSRASFHGAGPASYSVDSATAEISQKHFEYELATRKWDDRAGIIQSRRAHELGEPFTNIDWLHALMEKIAVENGLGLNLETKEKDKDGKEKQVSQQPGRLPSDMASAPTIQTTTRPAEDGGTPTAFNSSFVPFESYLADQLALLSIATKVHTRNVLEASYRVSKHRQATTHDVPPEWTDAAAPVPGIDANGTTEDTTEDGVDNSGSTASKSTVPAKRTGSEARLPNEILTSLRDLVRQDRSLEEKRLMRRQKRQKGNSAGPSRAGSVAPGTPGSVAPDPEVKPPTKKEIKRQQKLAEQSTAASVNSTTSHFLFGRKDKKKQKYSWMTSGTSTPTASRAPAGGLGGGGVGGAPGTPGPLSAAPAGPTMLTVEGRYRHGAFREDYLVGKTIQMRDMIRTLEQSGAQQDVLQLAYDRLDAAGGKLG